MANVLVAGGTNGILAASTHLTDVGGVFTPTDGTNTASSAPVLTPTFSGTAAQLSDTTRDYVVYLSVTTSGTATTVEMGPTSSANAVVLISSASVTAGQVVAFRLPAGWFVKASGTTTVFSQAAVGC
jgi:hypothetical protein